MPPQHPSPDSERTDVLWLLEFTRDGHRFRAELRPDPDAAPEPSRALAQGAWFVSMDGNPPRRAFDADVHDEDTEEFRRRVVSAAQGEIRRPEAGQKEQAHQDRPPDHPDETTQDHPRHRP